MMTDQIVALLIAERDKLNRAIEALQGTAKRRGRPPKNPLAAVAEPVAPSRPEKKRKARTAAQRKAQAERMKAYWAKRKKQAKG
jgi:hypothetical protein